ncbi:MAG TPA: hypothetical protein VI685_08615 [Candidatus Angelobacter sp.]
MRSDMKKVVVERPRSGSRQRNNKFGARIPYIPDYDYDEQPKKARGFESFTAGFRKRFTDVLGPLDGFLRKNVGRPWDKVYSELCAGLDKRKTTGLHIFQHVKDMVATSCRYGPDRKVYHMQWGKEYEVCGFYVHPRTGLLCEARGESKRDRARKFMLAEEEVTRLYLDNGHGYQKHNGIWYAVKWSRIVVGYNDPAIIVRDLFLKGLVQLNRGQYWMAVEKKQCNRDELKVVRELLESGQAREPKAFP